MIEKFVIMLFTIDMILAIILFFSISYYFITGKEFIEDLPIKLYFPILIIWVIIMLFGAFI